MSAILKIFQLNQFVVGTANNIVATVISAVVFKTKIAFFSIWSSVGKLRRRSEQSDPCDHPKIMCKLVRRCQRLTPPCQVNKSRQ